MFRSLHYWDLIEYPVGTKVKIDGEHTQIEGKFGNKQRGITDIKFSNGLHVIDSAYYHYKFEVLDYDVQDKVVEEFIEEVIDVCASMWREDSEGGDEYLIERAKKLKEDLGFVKGVKRK